MQQHTCTRHCQQQHCPEEPLLWAQLQEKALQLQNLCEVSVPLLLLVLALVGWNFPAWARDHVADAAEWFLSLLLLLLLGPG